MFRRRPMKTLLLLLLLVPVSFCHAQSTTDRASVQWGEELSDTKDGAFDEVIGYTDDHLYMTVLLKKELFLRKMDMNYRTVYQKLLPLKIDKDEHDLERVVVLGDRILLFTTFLDKKNKTVSSYMRPFQEADMKPMGRPIKLSTMDVESRRNVGNTSVHVSPDDQAFAISQLLPYDKDGSERFNFKVYDDELVLLWEQEVQLPYLDSEFRVENIRVADDGSIFMIGMKYAEKREAKSLKKEGKATYEYHLLVFHGDRAPMEDHKIEVPDKFLQDLTLNIGTEGDILCGGFYGSKGSFVISGAYFLRLDRVTKEVVHASYKEFDREFITAYMTEKEEAKATKKAEKKGEDLEMYSFELRDFVRRSDGGAVLVGEQYRFYTVTTCTTNANGGQTCRTSYHYVYNDIIVVNIDPNGDIAWAAKVPKRQHSVNDGGRYSSYALSVKEENIYLMFNDNGKNLFLLPGDKVESFKYGKDMLITLATINQDGKVFREALLPQEKRDAITRPKAGLQIADDRLFIYANWKKTHRFGTVTFN